MHKVEENRLSQSRKAFVFYLILSVLLLILPLKGFVSSVKAVLSYVFIPQIRAAHTSVEYFSDVNKTTKELLALHRQSIELEEAMIEARLIKEAAEVTAAENERLTSAIALAPQKQWAGVWAKTAYRDPSRWTSIIVDKGTGDGVKAKSAVIGFDGKTIALVGTVIEEGDNTSKVLLLNDEEFAAAAFLEGLGVEGLLHGNKNELKLRYVPLGVEVAPGMKVYSSKSSVIFPAGITIGTVSKVERGEDMKTHQTINVTPAVRPGAVKEVFIITGVKS